MISFQGLGDSSAKPPHQKLVLREDEPSFSGHEGALTTDQLWIMLESSEEEKAQGLLRWGIPLTTVRIEVPLPPPPMPSFLSREERWAGRPYSAPKLHAEASALIGVSDMASFFPEENPMWKWIRSMSNPENWYTPASFWKREATLVCVSSDRVSQVSMRGSWPSSVEISTDPTVYVAHHAFIKATLRFTLEADYWLHHTAPRDAVSLIDTLDDTSGARLKQLEYSGDPT